MAARTKIAQKAPKAVKPIVAKKVREFEQKEPGEQRGTSIDQILGSFKERRKGYQPLR